jgi:hypothetical protein
MAKFIPADLGPLNIWKHPEEGREYCIGIDTSTGLAKDYTVMQVITRSLPFEQVAMFRAKWSVVETSAMANNLGHFYNKALVVVETNYPGNAIQDALVQTYQYPRNYQKEDRMDENPHVSTKFGFQTTEASKWMLIRQMEQAIKNEEIIIHDNTTIDELMQFVYVEDKTKTGAASGLNDDCVMSIMLALHAALLYQQVGWQVKKVIENIDPDVAQRRNMMQRFRIQKIMQMRKKRENKEDEGILL